MAQHDTPPPVDFFLNPSEAHVYLTAFLKAEGTPYEPPYGPIREQVGKALQAAEDRKRRRQPPSEKVSDQRVRTWKKTFEVFGLVSVDDAGKIVLTPLGRAVRELQDRLTDQIDGANDRLAMYAVDVLNRQLLRNPVDAGNYPEDSDVFPFRLIWHAMRQLDDRLHWQEMNRVLMKVLRKTDEDRAIDKIRDARKRSGGVYDSAKLDEFLGEPAIPEDEETKRRITPWFQRAGFGGLLITPEDDAQGFRRLVPEYIPLIDGALEREPKVPDQARSSKAEYLRYLTDAPQIVGPPPNPSDKPDLDRITDAVERFGGTKIICLSGLPGTGKTYLARLAARSLVGGDSYRFMEIQFHESTSYEDFMEGFVPKPSGEGFELVDKVFRVINRRARLDPARSRYVLLIEEFTRANVHRVLGELLTYVEHRDRPFRLALSQKEEQLAANLVILATMNPRDKSAVILDQAILRRIHQVQIESSAARLEKILQGKMDDAILVRLVVWFRRYQDILPFGHAEFSNVRSETDLRELWRGTLRYFLMDTGGQIREQFRKLADDYPWQ